MEEPDIQTYGMQYELASPNSRRLMAMFVRMCEDRGIVYRNEQIFRYLHTFEEKCRNIQLSLFDDFGTLDAKKRRIRICTISYMLTKGRRLIATCLPK